MNSKAWHRTDLPMAETTSTLSATQESATLPLHDRERHNTPHYSYGVCKIFTFCHVTGGSSEKNIETTGFDWFAEDDLPPLPLQRTMKSRCACALRHTG